MNHFLTGGPAFPSIFINDGDRNVTAPDGQLVPPGGRVHMMGATVRDLFAGQALEGLCARNWSLPHPPQVADMAYGLADAMLVRRLKTGIQPESDEPKTQDAGAAPQSADNAADMKQGEGFDPAQLLRDMVKELGLGDLGPAIDSAGIGGSGRIDVHQLGEHVVIVHGGDRIAGFGISGARPVAPAVPERLRPYIQAVADLFIVRHSPHRVECQLCHSVATSYERLTHSSDCLVATAAKLLAKPGAK